MSAQEFDLYIRCPRGTVLVGGYTAPPGELDAVHARYRDGRAILPSTAVRGALREAYECLLRADGQPACSGGDGIDPAAPPATAPRACTLDEGRPCPACRLFGTQRPAIRPGERAFSALVLEDAVLDDAAADWVITHGVAVDRRRRSAREGLLFNRQTPAPGPHLAFVARGRLIDPDFRTHFEAAVAVARHLGGGRSRGLGRVDLEIRWHAQQVVEAPALPADEVQVRVTLERPASIGVPFALENHRATRHEIPGGALRGAIGFALAERLSDPDNDDPFQALVAEDGAIFDFLYPVTGTAPDQVAPWPVTARRCKASSEHPPGDTLLDRLAAHAVTTAEEAQRVEKHSAVACAQCGAATKARGGFRGMEGPVPTRIITRVELDRRLRSAREGRLFSYELIEENTTFVGSIRRIPAGSAGRLAEALAAALSLGRGRALGWGRVRVELAPVPARRPLKDRAAAFESAIRRRFRLAELKVPDGQLIQLTLLSPLLPDPLGDDGTATLAKALGLDADACIVKARRFGVETGWDQRQEDIDKQPEARQSVVAGSVFVFRLPAGRTLGDATPAIERLEREGAGERCHQGFGRVLAFDPAVCGGERK